MAGWIDDVSVFHWHFFYWICSSMSVILMCLSLLCLSVYYNWCVIIYCSLSNLKSHILFLFTLSFFYSFVHWNCASKLFISVNLNRKFECLKQHITKVKVVSPDVILCICSNIKNFSLDYLWHININITSAVFCFLPLYKRNKLSINLMNVDCEYQPQQFDWWDI